MAHRRKRRLEDWGRPILKIRNWGRPHFRRKALYFFAHLGLALSIALVVVVLAAGAFLLSLAVRNLIERGITNSLVIDLSTINGQAPTAKPSVAPSVSPPSVQYVPAPVPTATSTTSASPVYPITVFPPPAVSSTPQLPPNVLSSTFYFGFANSPWLDNGATTMYEDSNESALIFPPQYSWTRESSMPNTTYNIQNTVPGITTQIVRSGSDYKVLVFENGVPVLTATSTPIISAYPGTVGVGGTSDDFLVVYGGYKGAAAHITKSGNDWNVQDVSMYFPYRVMHGGFDPVVISPSGPSDNYYVFSDTPNNPKLVKLFSDASGSIIGAVDFTPLLFPSGVRSAIFSQSLTAQVTDISGAVSYYQFTDNGFKTAGPFTAQSTNINNYPWPVYGVTLTPDYGNLNGVTTQFFVSNDGKNWQPAPIGQEVTFTNTAGTELLWKAVFDPAGSGVSPFLGEVRLNFQVIRPQ